VDYKKLVSNLGHMGTSIAIGVIAVFGSVAIVLIAIVLFNIPFIQTNFAFAIVIPAIVAPSISWHFLKLYFKIEAMESQMRILATYDNLTGVLSRKAFMDSARDIFSCKESSYSSITLLYLDLDNFKQINDKYGHDGGDRVLKFVGDTLLKYFPNDIIGRLGGEEIGIVLIDISINRSTQILLDIQKIFSEVGVRGEDISIQFTVSIGMIVISEYGTELNRALHYADKALYQAKNSGKNCIYLYKSENNYERLGGEDE